MKPHPSSRDPFNTGRKEPDKQLVQAVHGGGAGAHQIGSPFVATSGASHIAPSMRYDDRGAEYDARTLAVGNSRKAARP